MFEPVAPGVARLGIVFVNVFALGEPGRPWLLVDAGLPGSAGFIRQAVRQRFGTGARPEAIVLTHGHFDHVGAARELAFGWDVPLYAHPLETPYLTGKSDYPPRDPTMGGAMAQMSRVMPDHGYDFGDRVQTLPENGSLPGLPDWRWLATPGHTPGHVSLHRETDGVLLAGDAFATMNLDSWTAYLSRERRFSRPSPPFTFDWETTYQSIQNLADLEPKVVTAGHGLPIAGDQAAVELHSFTRRFTPPRRGRYVARPPRADEGGVEELPPPVPDPYARRTSRAAVVIAAAATAHCMRRTDATTVGPRPSAPTPRIRRSPLASPREPSSWSDSTRRAPASLDGSPGPHWFSMRTTSSSGSVRRTDMSACRRSSALGSAGSKVL